MLFDPLCWRTLRYLRPPLCPAWPPKTGSDPACFCECIATLLMRLTSRPPKNTRANVMCGRSINGCVALQVVDMTAGNTLASMMNDVGATEFTGYGGLQAQGRIVALLRDGKPVDEAEEGWHCVLQQPSSSKSFLPRFIICIIPRDSPCQAVSIRGAHVATEEAAVSNGSERALSSTVGEEVDIVLDQTAFYAESGGQVGDRGLLTSVSDASDGGAGGPLTAVAAVHDVQRAAGGSLFVHSVAVQRGRMHVGQQVLCQQDHLIDRPSGRRSETQAMDP